MFVDLSPHPADSALCLHGGCRYDQIYQTAATPEATAALLNEAPADPGIWCTYGEFYAARGETEKAKAAFTRALVMGSSISSVLMRVANFDFTHGRTEEGLRLAKQILTQSDEFDGILFSYIRLSGQPASQLLGTVIPAENRPARSWLNWLNSRGSDEDILSTWNWMRKNQLGDEQMAEQTAATMWQRKSYAGAQELWADWLGEHRGSYLNPQRLLNPRFEQAPRRLPFDWNYTSNKAVAFNRQDGLVVHFLGQENLNSIGLTQATSTRPGRYRFSAEISADQITTDEGVYFQVVDYEARGRVNVESLPLLGSRERSQIQLDFEVPSGISAVQVRLLRHPSLKFDNKIAGTLHVYSTSLVPVSR